jgi:hypothetical protein
VMRIRKLCRLEAQVPSASPFQIMIVLVRH